jgi:GWxTD domain-containing protein
MFTTMRAFFFTLSIFCLAEISQAQSLSDVNYKFQYDRENRAALSLKSVRLSDGWTVFYKLELNDTSTTINDYTIEWERRNSISDKTGESLSSEAINLTIINIAQNKQTGKFHLPLSTTPQILVAKVVSQKDKQSLLYYKILAPDYPVNAYLKSVDNDPIFKSYITRGSSISIQGYASNDVLTVYHYNDFFPTAAPAFSEGQAKVSKGIKADSVFKTTADQLLTFKSTGLYLIQKDTNTVEGLAFRVEEVGYPKFRRVQDLVGPFIYICTKEEFQNLRMTGTDKKEFDREVLKITRSRERAQDFMRTYFQRTEAANQFFTSYKEGWKTDRGMMFIIYGQPDKVFKFGDREVWSYGKTNFNFIKSGTLFDPDNYVLLRNKKYTDDWYEKVDLVRNSRF